LKAEFITQADQVLSTCGRLVAPPGLGWVDIPFGLQYSKYLAAGAPDSTEEKLVETPVTFVIRSYQAYSQPATLGTVAWRLRFPNGRFYNSAVCAVSPSFDIGSFRQTIDPPLECPPGSRFFLTTDGLLSAAGTDVAITVLLEGAIRYTLKGTSAGCAAALGRNEPWASMPYFSQDPNGNILAPEWRLGCQRYPETPASYRDQQFTYLTPSSNAVAVPNDGSVVANVPLYIGSDADFVVRALNFVSTAVGGAAGTLFVRIRDHSGYELSDGFVWARRVSTVLFPQLWIKSAGGGGALFIDYMFVDTNATGSWLVQPVAFGCKRRSTV